MGSASSAVARSLRKGKGVVRQVSLSSADKGQIGDGMREGQRDTSISLVWVINASIGGCGRMRLLHVHGHRLVHEVSRLSLPIFRFGPVNGSGFVGQIILAHSWTQSFSLSRPFLFAWFPLLLLFLPLFSCRARVRHLHHMRL